MRALCWLPILAGCLGSRGTNSDRISDVGRACLTADGEFDPWTDAEQTTTLADGSRAVVVVELVQCESGSVDFEDLGCTATAGGATLEVHASAGRTWSTDGFTLDCNNIATTCETPPLSAGTWELTYGPGSTTFEVPYDGTLPCVDGGAYPDAW